MATAALGAGAADALGEDRRDHGWLFIGAILTGSFLLFLIQPMVARMALPRLGGAPAVWNSAMLVYQALLLGGYGYAHLLSRFTPRTQSAVQLLLLALAGLMLPITLSGGTPGPDVSPVLWVPGLLLSSIGPLFLAVAAQAPLLQRWYGAATGGRDPYPLYAASNLGSFAGLLAYPFLVEPRLALTGQSQFWSLGYVLLTVLTLGCALVLPRAGVDRHDAGFDPSPAPGWRQRGLWVVLAFVPSGLILSTTTFLTTDIVAMPLLWVAPLGLYLLSFTFAFAERRGAAALIVRAAPVLMLPLVALAVQPVAGRPLPTALAALALLFIVAVALHARLYDARPSPRHLTGFYLAMALGGALGGAFAALVAPLAFDWSYEHPLLLLAAAALVPLWRLPGAAGRMIVLAGPVLIALIVAAALARIGPFGAAQGMTLAALLIGVIAIACAGRRAVFVVAVLGILLVSGGADALSLSNQPGARMRSYFGIYTVRDRGGVRVLAHGTTAHGLQRLAGPERLRPTSYYGPDAGIGRALTALPGIAGPRARVGVVGLGAGTLACYARPGQQWRFFEIDPLMVRVARTRFSFLSGCAPGAGIVIGDARLSLARARPGSFDLLALDAFSSDAVPMHLLTGEAFALYRRVLAPNGLLLVHITNRHLRLEPVIAQAALAGGWSARLLDHRVRPGTPAARLENSSIWVALSPDQAVIDAAAPRSPGGWRALRPMPGFAGWSDDYGSILPLIRTGQRQ